jgi:hypothetical protein
MLAHIVRARHEHLPLESVVNEAYQTYRMAVPAADAGKLKRIHRWLAQRGVMA